MPFNTTAPQHPITAITHQKGFIINSISIHCLHVYHGSFPRYLYQNSVILSLGCSFPQCGLSASSCSRNHVFILCYSFVTSSHVESPSFLTVVRNLSYGGELNGSISVSIRVPLCSYREYSFIGTGSKL